MISFGERGLRFGFYFSLLDLERGKKVIVISVMSETKK